MSALFGAATCRGVQSGVVPPQSKGGIMKPNGLPPVQGWPTRGREGGSMPNVELSNVQGKAKGFVWECAGTTALFLAATCRGPKSGVMPPHST